MLNDNRSIIKSEVQYTLVVLSFVSFDPNDIYRV
jgi:NADH:ubiquinone oxidoreductase subunit 3 (subunit A)